MVASRAPSPHLSVSRLQRARASLPRRPRLPALTPFARTLLWAAAAAPLGLAPQAALAQPATAPAQAWQDFDIPAGSLDQALVRFGQQSGAALSVDARITAGLSTAGLRGRYSRDDALARLLDGTGMQAVRDATGEYTLRPRPEAAAGGAATLPAIAVTGNNTEAERLNPPTTVGSKTPLAQREIPQSVNVITQAQIQAQNLSTIADVVDRSPGVTVIRGLPTPFLGSQAYSRGWQITNYNVDGIPTTIDLMPQQNSALYDRVEVLHGAAGLYGGLGGAGGTINVVHKQPGKDFALNSSASIGTHDTYIGQIDATGPLNEAGTLRGRGVVSWQRLGYDNGTFDKGTSVYGILEADIAPRTLVQLGASYEADSGRPDTGFPNEEGGKLSQPSRSNSSFYPPWQRYTNDVATVFANISHRLENDWTLKLAGHYSDTRTLNHNTWAASAMDPATQTFLAWAAYSPYSRHEQAYDLYADGPFTLFQRKHHLTIGANYYKLDLKSDLNEPWDIFTTSFATSYLMPGFDWQTTGGGVYEDRQRQTAENYGVYANARFSLADPLTLVLGGRMAWYKDSTTNDYNNNGAFSSASTGYGYHNKLTPFAGLIYDIDKTYSAYLSYSTVFTPRNVTDKTGNLMKPLEGRQYELGIKGEYFEGKLNASAAIFRGTQKNRIVQDPTDHNYYVPAGSARVQGAEIMASGQLTDSLTLSGGYTYLNTQVFDDNASNSNFSQYTPKHMFKLWANYRLPGSLEQWSVGGGVTAVSATGFQDWRQGGYAITSAAIGYKVDRNVQLSLSVTNLFDRYYYDYVGSGYNHLGPGRNAMLTVRATY